MNVFLLSALSRLVLSSFPERVNDQFSKLMRDPKLQKDVIKEAADYREDMTDDEVLDRAFGEIYPRWMEDFDMRASYEGENVILYRAIAAKSFSDIKLNGLGIFWTWDQSKAANYSDKGSGLPLFVVTASVPVSSINLYSTLKKIVWPGYDFEESEREFELKKGGKLTILSVEKDGQDFLKKPQSATA